MIISNAEELESFLSASSHGMETSETVPKARRLTPSPFDCANLNIVIAQTPKQAEHLVSLGYCPVEASWGSSSVVDHLLMDHHGALGHLESVAIRAYRDHFGARRYDPRFVTTGFPDEDATFAIASLAGILPHPSFVDSFPLATKPVQSVMKHYFEHIAQLIGDVDTHPENADKLKKSYAGRTVLTWRQLSHATARDILAWYEAVGRWRTLLTRDMDAVIAISPVLLQERIQSVLSLTHELVTPEVLVIDLSTTGPDSNVYKELLKKAPIVVAFFGGVEGDGVCSFIASPEMGPRLLGDFVFTNIYPKLTPSGCGGRPIIGGSPRRLFIRWEDAVNYGRQIAKAIHDHQNK